MIHKITTLALASSLLLFGALAHADHHKVNLEGKKVAVLIADGFHDGETLSPMFYLRELGAEITLISTSKGKISAYNSEVTLDIQHALSELSADSFHALILPGGRSPATLRENHDVLRFVQAFHATGRPIASICHGPQVLVSAGLLDGVRTTCIASIADEVKGGGAEYVDEEVVLDGQFISSRLPHDLPAFNAAIAQALADS